MIIATVVMDRPSTKPDSYFLGIVHRCGHVRHSSQFFKPIENAIIKVHSYSSGSQPSHALNKRMELHFQHTQLDGSFFPLHYTPQSWINIAPVAKKMNLSFLCLEGLSHRFLQSFCVATVYCLLLFHVIV